MIDVEAVLLRTMAPRPKGSRPIVLIGAGGIAREAPLPAYRRADFPMVMDLDRAKDGVVTKMSEKEGR